MKKIVMIAIAALLVDVSAYAGAIHSQQILLWEWPDNPPGYLVDDDQTFSDYDIEIHFRYDAQADPGQSFRCGTPVPDGHWLLDHSGGPVGSLFAVVGNGRLCWAELSPNSFATISGVQDQACHVFRAVRVGANLTLSLDNESRSFVGGGGVYRVIPVGIGVGRESQGWHSFYAQDSFPGEISYLRINDRVFDFATEGRVTGGASIGPSLCSSVPQPDPDPEPEPEGPCDTDPDGAECQCILDPHPACNVCLAP